MNITPQQIPDEAARAALEKYYRMTGIKADSCIPYMKAALAAALPVLLGEPVLFQSRDRFMEFNWGPWITFEYEQDRDSDFIRMSNADGWQAEKRDLYTLSTQDTPNADQ